jgi:hypothetical protein
MATDLKLKREKIASDAKSLYIEDLTEYDKPGEPSRADLAMIVYGFKMVHGEADAESEVFAYDVFGTGTYVETPAVADNPETEEDESQAAVMAEGALIEASLTGDALYRFHGVLLRKLSLADPGAGPSLVGGLFYDPAGATPVIITAAEQDPETMLYSYSYETATRGTVLKNVHRAYSDFVLYDPAVYQACLELERLMHGAFTNTCRDRKLFIDKGLELQWLMDSVAVYFDQKYYPKTAELIAHISGFVGHCKKTCAC